MKKGRFQEAFGSFCRIRNSEMIAARDLYYAHRQVLEEKNAFGGQTLGRRMLDLVLVPRLRRATVASAWIVISQQFSGKNTCCEHRVQLRTDSHLRHQYHGLLLVNNF